MKSYKSALLKQYENEQAKKQQCVFNKQIAPNSKMKSLPEGFEFIIQEQPLLIADKVEKFNIHELNRRSVVDLQAVVQDDQVEEAEMAGPSLSLFVPEAKDKSQSSSESSGEDDLRDY